MCMGPSEDGCPGARVVGGFEPPDMNPGSQTLVLARMLCAQNYPVTFSTPHITFFINFRPDFHGAGPICKI